MYFIILPLLIVVAVLARIAYALYRTRHKKLGDDPNWYTRLGLTAEDYISQMYAVAGMVFFFILLMVANTNYQWGLEHKVIVFMISICVGVFAYWKKILILLPCALTGLAVSWFVSAVEWSTNDKISALIIPVIGVVFALFLYVVGRIHDHYSLKRSGFVYSTLGIIFVYATLILLSTHAGMRLVVASIGEMPITSSSVFVINVLVFALGLIGAMGYALYKKCLHMREVAAFIGILAVVGAAYALSGSTDIFIAQESGWLFFRKMEFTTTGILWAGLFNLSLFMYAVAIIFLGYIRKEIWLINSAALAIFLLIVWKYFDWFYSFMDKSLFFLSAGIMLFVTGWFMDKGRRKVLKKLA